MVGNEMKVAIVCIAKNEDLYLDEWVNYHLKLGFDRIFVYMNNWRTNYHNDKVTLIEFDGKESQLPAYNSFIIKNDEYDWTAFIDVDEFIVLKKHKRIKEFLSDYSQHDSICMSWVLFGSNNLSFDKNGDKSVLRRFTKRQKGINNHVKVFVKKNKTVKFLDPHHVSLPWVDTNHQKGTGPLNLKPVTDVIQLNHYFTKTKEEFLKKIERGRADLDTASSNRTLSDFTKHDLNEIEDLLALEFYNSTE
jgi:Glycosyl transferase family 2